MDEPKLPLDGELVRRHRLSTRLWHWANAAVLLVMLMSGLMIFNAHPRLYWGQYGANFDSAWLEIGAIGDPGRERGAIMIGGHSFDTTGVLGLSTGPDGQPLALAFPGWATIPSSYSLADARLWHLAFAPLLIALLAGYLGWSLANGHLRRDLWLRNGEWRPAHVWRDVVAHLRLRFPTGAAATRYNVLQKLAYLSVLLVALPGVIVSGLAMGPGMDAAWPWLTVVLGGRQSARSLHFLCAFALLGFFVVHIVMVVLAGPINELRSMVTGWYRLPREKRR